MVELPNQPEPQLDFEHTEWGYYDSQSLPRPMERKLKNRVGIKDMSLKKLVKEMVEPIVEDIGGIVASDGTIKGGSKLSKIKKMKKKGHTSVPYGSGYKKVNESEVKANYIVYFNDLETLLKMLQI